MRVTLCAGGDWANVGYEYAKALKSCGIDAQMLKLRRHHFKYKPTADLVEIEIMIDKIMESDIVIMMHSDRRLLKDLQELNILSVFKRLGGKIIAFHGGSAYRQNSGSYHKSFRWLIDATVIQTYDLLDKDAENEFWILPPVDLERIQPDYDFRDKSKLILGHFPSGIKWKNTVLINKVVASLDQSKIEYLHSVERINNYDNLLRMNECDIYIEHQQYMQWDKVYGEFGVACLEAAALGKIVVTCTNGKDEYEKQYGKMLPLVISNSPEELKDKLEKLIDTPRNLILRLKKWTREWVETCHSYKVIGLRLKAVCESVLV